MKENREKTDAVTQASRTLTYLENQQKTLEQEHCVAVECFKETIKRLEDELKKQHRDMYVRDFCDKASETGTCDEDVAKMINQVDSYARLDDMMRTKEEHEQLIQELQCTTETLKDEIQKITCSKSDLEIELEVSGCIKGFCTRTTFANPFNYDAIFYRISRRISSKKRKCERICCVKTRNCRTRRRNMKLAYRQQLKPLTGL